MQTDLDRKWNDRITYGGGRIIFVAFFIFSLIPIGQTLRSSLGAQIAFEVIAMWVMLLLAGLIVWVSATKQRMERTTAGAVLMQISSAALIGFSAFAEIATHH